ncbi:MAG: AraC-like DNA-binding protein [Crocinitomicaceae bacterium]
MIFRYNKDRQEPPRSISIKCQLIDIWCQSLKFLPLRMHFNGRFIVNLAQFAGQLGANPADIITASGVPFEELCSETSTVDVETYNNVVGAAVKATNDPFFGLHAGENLNLVAAGLIAQIAHSSSTVKEALEYCCQFANLGCSALAVQLSEIPEAYKFSMNPDKGWMQSAPESVQHTIDGYLAFTVREFQSLIGNKNYPKEIWLSRKSPQNWKELQRVVGCDIKFEQGEDALLFHKKDVELPVVTSDYALLQVLVKHAEEKRSTLDGQDGFYERVKRSLINLIKPDFPTIESIAGHLNMSVRSFQRKLKLEGHSYKEVVDDLKQEFAFDYLKQSDLNISEIAYLLNYADASAFIRSFKRWTGKTPNEYRMSLN